MSESEARRPFEDPSLPTEERIDDLDERLDDICDRLGLFPPWQQWSGEGGTIAPITAKKGSIEPLKEALRGHFREAKRDDLLQFVT